MKQRYACLLILLSLGFGNGLQLGGAGLAAQESSVAAPAESPAITGLSHTEVLLYGGIPYVGTYLVTIPELIWPYELSKYISAGLSLAAGIPHMILDPGWGLLEAGISASAYAAGFGLEAIPELYGNRSLAATSINIGMKTAMWSYFEGYAAARQQARPGEYSRAFNPPSFSSLMAAPWQAENLGRTSVWVPLAINMAAGIATQAISTGGSKAVWTTNKAFVGQAEVPIALGLVSTVAMAILNHSFTGIGEEALFRGVGYEEMYIGLGPIAAKIIDAVAFPAIHVPYEIQTGKDAGSILLNFGSRSAITLGLQWAYDDGGLPASVAQHMWIDVMYAVINYLFTAGVPQL